MREGEGKVGEGENGQSGQIREGKPKQETELVLASANVHLTRRSSTRCT